MANKVAFPAYVVIDLDTGVGKQASITVYEAGTLNKATIYSDEVGTPKSNPFNTDSKGRIEDLYLDEGEYDIQVSGTGIDTYTIEDVSIIGYADQYLKGIFDNDYKMFLVKS